MTKKGRRRRNEERDNQTERFLLSSGSPWNKTFLPFAVENLVTEIYYTRLLEIYDSSLLSS